MSFLDYLIGALEKPISSLPTRVTGQGGWLKAYFDGSAQQIKEAFNGLVHFLAENVYTRSQTDTQISQRIQDIGAGDMAKAVYDTDDDGVVDRAEHADTADTATSATSAASAAKADNGLNLYRMVLPLDGWNGVSAPFTQTVACSPVSAGAAAVTSGMTIRAIKRAQSRNAEVTAAEAGVLSMVLAGYVELGAGTVTCELQERPSADATLYLEVSL